MDLPVVVIGADCAVLGAAAVDERGAPAYCARGAGSLPVWSLHPDRVRPQETPSSPVVAVTMTP
jgi:serine/threonine-protein kinase